jgi:hypothetical protein
MFTLMLGAKTMGIALANSASARSDQPTSPSCRRLPHAREKRPHAPACLQSGEMMKTSVPTRRNIGEQ